MESRILDYIIENKLFDVNDKVLVGVSGGADSLCLLFVLNKLKEALGISIAAIHVHHGIRGKEADEDAEYVNEVCKKWGIECFTKYVDVKSAAVLNHQSTEEAARALRYKMFDIVSSECGCSKIAVAHHSDDQAETILFQMFRGSGLRGISGMEPVRGNIVRPLLRVNREEIERYLADNKIEFRTDSTNLETDYSRNKLRHQLLPFIKENINSRVVEHLLDLSDETRMTEDYLRRQAYIIFHKYIINNENEIENNIIDRRVIIDDKIFGEEKLLVYYVFRICINKVTNTMKDITRRHVDNIYNLKNSNGYKKINLPYGICVVKSYNHIIFEKEEQEDFCFDDIIMDKRDLEPYKSKVIALKSGGSITFEVRERKKFENFEKKACTKWIDYDKIKDIFAIRLRKPGDYLVINDSGNRKKLKDYFIDIKIPRDLRDRQLLVADGSHVIWVIGQRISEDVKIDDDTERILQIEAIQPK